MVIEYLGRACGGVENRCGTALPLESDPSKRGA